MDRADLFCGKCGARKQKNATKILIPLLLIFACTFVAAVVFCIRELQSKPQLQTGNSRDADVVGGLLAAEKDTDYLLYTPAIENAIKEKPYPGDEYGLLYDLDEDGVNELFMLHSYFSDDGSAIPTIGFSVYDIEQNNLVVKAEKQKLATMAGGGGITVGIADYHGNECFFTIVSVAWDLGQREEIQLYDFGTMAPCVYAEYTYSPVDGTSTSSCNGISCTVDDFEQLKSDMKPIQIMDTMSIEADPQDHWNETTLSELLRQLRESPVPGNQDVTEKDWSDNPGDSEFVAKNSKFAAKQYFSERILPYYEVDDCAYTLTYYCQTYCPESYSSITEDNMYSGNRPQDVLLAYNICDLDGNGVDDLTLATAYYADPISLYDYSGVVPGERIFSLNFGTDTFLFDQDGSICDQYHNGNGNFGDLAGTPKKVFCFFQEKYLVYGYAYDYSETDLNGVYYPVTENAAWHTECLDIKEFNTDTGEYDYVLDFTRIVKNESVQYYNDPALDNCLFSSSDENYGEFKTEDEAVEIIRRELGSLAIDNIIIEPISWDRRWEAAFDPKGSSGIAITVFELQPSISTFCGSAGSIKDKYPDLDIPSEYRNLRGTTSGTMNVSISHL